MKHVVGMRTKKKKHHTHKRINGKVKAIMMQFAWGTLQRMDVDFIMKWLICYSVTVTTITWRQFMQWMACVKRGVPHLGPASW